MRRRAPRPLALALAGLTDGLTPTTTLARVQRTWPQVVGPVIARAGSPTAERDGVLTVTCADAVWAAELDMMSAELIARLNRALEGELIHKLRCRTGQPA
jgi:predicted nucleic acid-binding Zn ribbon protein